MALKNTLGRSHMSFVDYYKNDVSQFGRLLYVIGAVALIIATSVVFLSSLFELVFPLMESLAADTVIVSDYGILNALSDASTNMAIAIAISALVFPPIIWLFAYIGKRIPIAYRIMFSTRNQVAEPRHIRRSHIIFITVGFVLPCTLITYAGYLISCNVKYENIDVTKLVSDQYIPSSDDVLEKLQTGKLIRYYESICENEQLDGDKLEKVWEKVQERGPDKVVGLIRDVATSQCLSEKIDSSDILDLESLLEELST